MPPKIEMVGKVFGELTVVFRAENSIRNQARWICRCSCGNATKPIQGADLRGGKRSSCGCKKNERIAALNRSHGHTIGKKPSPEYTAYNNIIRRCRKDAQKKDRIVYFDRGIGMCDRWKYGENDRSGFECFLADMGTRPEVGMSVERKNNDLGYSPDNCRWATAIEQANNKRNNRIVEIDGELVNFTTAWRNSRKVVGFGTAHARLKDGWSAKEAITVPRVPVHGKRAKGSHHTF
jgi:hypothetical protein